MYIRHALIRLAMTVGVVAFFLAVVPSAYTGVGALTQAQQREAICAGTGGVIAGEDCATGVLEPGVPQTFRNVTNIILFILGAIAVIMVVIGGVRYALSGGDSSQTKTAKDTIIYALIGVVVAFIAYAIVDFVLDNID